MNGKGRTNDLDAITNIILHAEKYIYISIVDYYPLTVYTPKHHYWPYIDDALRTAAVENKVLIKILVTKRNSTKTSEEYFLNSLQSLSNSFKGVDIQVVRTL